MDHLHRHIQSTCLIDDVVVRYTEFYGFHFPYRRQQALHCVAMVDRANNEPIELKVKTKIIFTVRKSETKSWIYHLKIDQEDKLVDWLEEILVEWLENQDLLVEPKHHPRHYCVGRVLHSSSWYAPANRMLNTNIDVTDELYRELSSVNA